MKLRDAIYYYYYWSESHNVWINSLCRQKYLENKILIELKNSKNCGRKWRDKKRDNRIKEKEKGREGERRRYIGWRREIERKGKSKREGGRERGRLLLAYQISRILLWKNSSLPGKRSGRGLKIQQTSNGPTQKQLNKFRFFYRSLCRVRQQREFHSSYYSACQRCTEIPISVDFERKISINLNIAKQDLVQFKKKY